MFSAPGADLKKSAERLICRYFSRLKIPAMDPFAVIGKGISAYAWYPIPVQVLRMCRLLTKTGQDDIGYKPRPRSLLSRQARYQTGSDIFTYFDVLFT
jgi:hypothetical protein